MFYSEWKHTHHILKVDLYNLCVLGYSFFSSMGRHKSTGVNTLQGSSRFNLLKALFFYKKALNATENYIFAFSKHFSNIKITAG